MTQLPFDLPKYKNGKGSHRWREPDLGADVKQWLANLDVANALHREQLHQLAERCAQVYRPPRTRRVAPKSGVPRPPASDTEPKLEAEIAALEGDVEQAIVEGKSRLSWLSARLADLKRRLAKFEPSTKQ